MNARVDAFAVLKEPTSFPTKPKAQAPVEEAALDEVARQNNFPSRPANRAAKPERRKQRRYRTGRNQHLGIRATTETLERFYKAADARGVPLGELLRLALDALDRAGDPG
jgi:hypothetical protein